MAVEAVGFKSFTPEFKPVLPPHIYQEGGELYFRQEVVTEGELGPFHQIADFGHSLEPLRIPATKEQIRDLAHTSFLDNRRVISYGMRTVTDIANGSSYSPDDPSSREHYQTAITPVVDLVLTEALARAKGTITLMPPLNGGKFVKDRFVQLPTVPRSIEIVDYRASRVVGPNGYNIGLRFNDRLPDILPGATVIFADDCIAAVGTLFASLHALPHQDVQVLIAATALTVRGAMAIEATLPQMGFTDFHAFAGIPVFAMNNDYYLLRTQEEGYPEGTFVVGDMGKFLRPI